MALLVQEVTVTAGNSKSYSVTINRAGDIAQYAYGKASNTEVGDEFGASVALSGDTLAVGAPGEDSSATGVGGTQSDNSTTNSGAVIRVTLPPP